MSILGFGKAIGGIVDSAKEALGLNPKPTPSVGGNSSLYGPEFELEQIYENIKENWYSAKPYGFKMKNWGGQTFVMFLPISPSNITISTNFATNLIPTLYGTVEEHSPVRYYDISIEGTTGFAPRYVQPAMGEPKAAHDSSKASRAGRQSFSVGGDLGGALGGFFPKTLSLISKTLNKAADLIDGGPATKMGISNSSSGYLAFHNLYKFLLYHKKIASGEMPSSESKLLTFFNYKDNNEYSVVVRNFTLRRSADNPMLYFYSIQMRGYNLRTIGKDQQIVEDLNARLENLGLNGVKSSSIFGSIKNIASGVKSIIGTAAGGIGGFGR